MRSCVRRGGACPAKKLRGSIEAGSAFFMFKIKCKDLTNTDCVFVATGDTAEEAKKKFYKHGAQDLAHKKRYYNATEEEKHVFAEKIDDYLKNQK